jgi:UDP-N-acetylglucosamine--N-acetylmuramyl-(pentapeptide) pyrophosphoryl-undecaprenol N-acetylglucosamine transferase
MKIGLVGGASGGHFYPLMAVADELNHTPQNPKLYYFGPSPYDADQLKSYQIEYIYCPAGKLRRYLSIQNFFDLFRTFGGFFVAVWKLYIIYPDVIFSKGGYTAVPILLAARILTIPVVIHESDTTPGKANDLAKKFARYIAISYDEAAAFFPPEKTALTGIPLRTELKHILEDPFSVIGIPNDKPLIYVTGGSQGAERLNNVILNSLDELLPKYRIFHQTGPQIELVQQTAQGLLEGTDLASSYYVAETVPVHTVSALMQAASLVITRAGSTTLFELAYFGTPAIIIPIPEDVSRDQRTNAYTYARGGGASVIEEHNLTDHLLANEIATIMGDQQKLAAMSSSAKASFIPDAASKLATVLISIGTEHERKSK